MPTPARENFVRTMVISCYSFTECARRAAPLMTDGGAMITLTYAGSVRIMPNYNVMGVAKAGLEASVRYLANDYGPKSIRVNAISAGPDPHARRRGHRRFPARCSPTSSATRRSGAPSPSTRSAARRSICFPSCHRA